MRSRLIAVAARIISEDGLRALSARKVASEVGTSTMAVYTQFGKVDGLVSAVIDEGFERLAKHMEAVPPDADPFTVLLGLATAYRDQALSNPHLYTVMFGSASVGRHEGEELERGRPTFEVLVSAIRSAMDAGRMKAADPEAVAGQLWSALHGFVMLELAGFMRSEDGAEREVLLPLLVNLGTALSNDA